MNFSSIAFCLISLIFAAVGSVGASSVSMTEEDRADATEIAIDFIMDWNPDLQFRLKSFQESLRVTEKRFNASTGYSVTVRNEELLMVVSLSRRGVTFIQFSKVLRKAPDCDDQVARKLLIQKETAYEEARRFVETGFPDVSLADLQLTSSELLCPGGLLVFRFIWRESYDEENTALHSTNVEVQIDPLSGKVVSGSRVESKYSGELLISADDCRRIIRERFGSIEGFRIERMVLVSTISKDQREEPVWAVELDIPDEMEDQVGGPREGHYRYVDGISGELSVAP